MPLTPKAAASDAILRAEKIFAYSQDYELSDGIADDLARSALVMGVAALDTYLHEAVIKTVRAWNPRASLAKQEFRFDEVCALVGQAVEGRSQDEHSRPWVQVKDALRERLLKMSFQSSRSVESALLMCGVRNGWKKIAGERRISATALKNRLDAIVYRRNKIVHESDLERSSRPRRVRHTSVDPGRVKRDLKWLARLIEAMDAVVNP